MRPLPPEAWADLRRVRAGISTISRYPIRAPPQSVPSVSGGRPTGNWEPRARLGRSSRAMR
eukprot:875646-Lingulodinium_polyedra.AAC.1